MRDEGPRFSDGEAPAQLVAVARHDRAAFGELYDLYYPRVYGLCRKYSETREEAEDLAAEPSSGHSPVWRSTRTATFLFRAGCCASRAI